jgi:hypothetical protein
LSRETLRSYVEDVGELGRSGLGKIRDKLGALGAPRTKQQHMPLKMALGLAHSREKHAKRRIEEARRSGTVLPSSTSKKQKTDKPSEESGPSLGFARGSVLDLSKGKSNRTFLSRLKNSKEDKQGSRRKSK